MVFLAKICQEAGICHFDNVEYRYCRVTALRPVISFLVTDPAAIVSTAVITISDLVAEVAALCAEVRQYHDGAALNKIYTEILKGCIKKMSRLRLVESKHLSVAAYIKRYLSIHDRFKEIKRLLIFDSVLLDAKIIHQMHNFHDSAAVLVIAGGAHIARVNDILQSVGYELLYTSKVTMMHTPDLQKCVG